MGEYKLEQVDVIKKEFMLYKIREVEIEDIKLKIEDLKLGEKFNLISYEERVQSSKRCTNNDSIMNEIERLEFEKNKKIIANKRVSNYLKVLDQVEAEVIKMILIDKKSKTYTVKTLDRSGRHIDRILERALKKIADIC